MIYLELENDMPIVILTKKDVRLIRSGVPIMGPTNRVMVGFTHDEKETFGLIKSMCETTGAVLDVELLKFIFEESAKVKPKCSVNAADATSEPSSKA